MFYVISLKHTSKTDRFLLLWRENNAGYTYGTNSAGRYEKVVPDYHDSEGNLPLKIIDESIMLDYGMTDEHEIGILNTEHNRNLLKIEFRRGNLIKSPKN